MKKLLFSLLILFSCTQTFSQKIYFAYFQSESGQPFYVRMNEKVYSSTGSGYLILSRLHDSTYQIHLGFPGQNQEQKFSIPIDHKDRGFLVKNFGEKGWGLFDLQSLQVQMPVAAITPVKTVKDENVSPFTEILSKAADDPSLKEKPVVEEKKKDPVIVAVQKEETKPAAVSKSEPEEVVKKEPVPETTLPVAVKETQPDPPVKKEVKPEETHAVVTEKPVANVSNSEKKDSYKPSRVTRTTQSSGDEGHEIVFIDTPESGNSDTIRVLIPNNKPIVKQVAEEKKEEKKFLDITAEPSKTETRESEVPVRESVSAKPPVVNNCKNTADDNDFLKLRRKMVAADNDDDMVTEARKYFKSTCFTVYQIRNLGNLFLSDEGKYKLFDAAYRYVSDSHNFLSLKMELKEGYWVKRFEAML